MLSGEDQKTEASSGLVRKPRIGLALGGGGARGLAHILVLEAFDELGLRPSEITGTSIGAMFGAAYASGLTAAQIRAHAEEVLSNRTYMLRQLFAARNVPLQRLFSIVQLRSALFNPQTLIETVLPQRTAKTFEDLQIPLKIITTDFYSQDQIVIETGELYPAVAASMALPAIFAPVMLKDPIAGELALMDGGAVNPLPFDCFSNDIEITVAINVCGGGAPPEERLPPGVMESVIASSQIMQNTVVREKLKSRKPDILIEVDVGQFHVLEFQKLPEVLEAAASAKAELLTKLSRVLGAQTLEELSEPARLEPPPDQPAITRRLAARILGNG